MIKNCLRRRRRRRISAISVLPTTYHSLSISQHRVSYQQNVKSRSKVPNSSKKLRFTQIIYISDTIPTNLHIKWQSWDCFAILVHFLTSAEKLSIPQELYIRAANMYSSSFLRIFKHQNNRSKRVLRVNSVFTKFASQRDFDPFWLFRSYLVWREACHSWTRDKMLPDSHRGKILSHIFLSRSDNSFKGRKAKIEECWNEAK